MSIKLSFLRHGESIWNLENRFTGWTDVDLTKNGKNEAKKAGLLLLNENIELNAFMYPILKVLLKRVKYA